MEVGDTTFGYKKRQPIVALFTFIRQQKYYNVVFVSLLFFFVYSEIPLPISSDKLIPGFLLLPMVVLMWPTLSLQLKVKHLYFALGIAGIAAVSNLPNVAQLAPAVIAFRVLQFFYSLVIALCVIIYAASLEAKTLRNICLFFTLGIVIGCFLERIGILSPITVAFQQVYGNTDYFGEIDQVRDINVSGFVRPVLFTSEPSLVGFGYFCFSSCFIILNKSLKLDFLIFICSLLAFILLGSPTVLLALIYQIIIVIFKQRIGLFWIGILIATLLLIGLLLYYSSITTDLFNLIASRFGEEMFNEGSSMYARIYVPYFKVLPTVISRKPFLGVGYGNHNLIHGLLGYRGELEEMEAQYIRGANAFVNFISYLGVLGTIGVLYLIIKLCKNLNVKQIGAVLLFWFFQNQMIGTYATPRTWCYLGLIIASLSLSNWPPKKQPTHNHNSALTS